MPNQLLIQKHGTEMIPMFCEVAEFLSKNYNPESDSIEKQFQFCDFLLIST